MQVHKIPTPTDKQISAEKKAVRLEWFSLAYLATLVPIMFAVMGSSQAMKTAWIEDVLSLIPPTLFLITNRIRKKQATPHFPRGFARATSIGFLLAAVTLLVFGLSLTVGGATALITRDKPIIGNESIFGYSLWSGWLMLAAIAYSGIPPVILGRIKVKLAEPIHDKVLYTDAMMNKGDWMSSGATAIGVLGIGLGFWWTDALAAILVSLDISRDGWNQVKDATTELIGRAPKSLDGKYLDLPEQVKKLVESFTWVAAANIHMYEHGRLIYTEVNVILPSNQKLEAPLVQSATQKIKDLNWRLEDIVFTIL